MYKRPFARDQGPGGLDFLELGIHFIIRVISVSLPRSSPKADN